MNFYLNIKKVIDKNSVVVRDYYNYFSFWKVKIQEVGLIINEIIYIKFWILWKLYFLFLLNINKI